jgi:hypothetical protein
MGLTLAQVLFKKGGATREARHSHDRFPGWESNPGNQM